jgi:glycosyltransferase involved in cell wall biosynthesis
VEQFKASIIKNSLFELMKVSVIFPAYKEESTIEEAIKRADHLLKETGFDYEIIAVENGSGDATRDRALRYARNNSHVKVVSHPSNMGKGLRRLKGV